MNEKIKKINAMLNRNVAYAEKTEKRGGYTLKFANTNKIILVSSSFSEFKEAIEELLETGIQDGNHKFSIKK